MSLTTKYIEEHAANVHTADSFGRGIADAALKAAFDAATREGGAIDRFQTDAQLSVEAFEPLGCIRVCVNTPFGRLCYHIKV